MIEPVLAPTVPAQTIPQKKAIIWITTSRALLNKINNQWGSILKVENAHRLEETLATLHPECAFADLPLGVTYRGREGARRHYRIWREAFDVTVQGSARHWTTTGDMIAEARYLGRHVGSFYGLEATQRAISISAWLCSSRLPTDSC